MGRTAKMPAKERARASEKEHTEWEQEELETSVHWLRQAVAFITGVLCGMLPVRGFPGLMAFAVVNVCVLAMYYGTYLGIDQEVYNSKFELLKAGMMPAFGVFLATWTITYTSVHF